MTLKACFFDMDHTIIGVDSDVTWKTFSVGRGLTDPRDIERSEYYFGLYNQGKLDIDEFLKFQISEFIGKTVAEMEALCREHFDSCVKSAVYPKAFDLIQEMKSRRLPVVMLTATNTTIAKPIAEYFGFDTLIGTELEIIDGRYSGKRSGIYASGEGKVAKAGEECAKRRLTLAEISYYGDSINDKQILSRVGYPCAANPSDSLRALAEENHWQIIDFKNKEA